MKNNDAFQILKTFAKAVQDPNYISEKLEKSDFMKLAKGTYLNNNTVGKNVYPQYKKNNQQYNKTIPTDVIDSFGNDINNTSKNNANIDNNNINNDYSAKKKDTSSNPQQVLDSIAEELTPAKLQQAIILSEIVGKPRSKTRKRRRF